MKWNGMEARLSREPPPTLSWAVSSAKLGFKTNIILTREKKICKSKLGLQIKINGVKKPKNTGV